MKYQLLLLHEFHILRQKKPETMNCVLFGSFLDRFSFECALKIINREWILNSEMRQRDCCWSVVFFPISTDLAINTKFLNQTAQILANSIDLTVLTNNLRFIREVGIINVNASKYMKKQLLSLYSNENKNQFPSFYQNQSSSSMFNYNSPQYYSRCSQFQINQFLFGRLAAIYLERIIQFPTIFYNDQKFHGIPLNYKSIDAFLTAIFPPDSLSIEPYTHLEIE